MQSGHIFSFLVPLSFGFSFGLFGVLRFGCVVGDCRGRALGLKSDAVLSDCSVKAFAFLAGWFCGVFSDVTPICGIFVFFHRPLASC